MSEGEKVYYPKAEQKIRENRQIVTDTPYGQPFPPECQSEIDSIKARLLNKDTREMVTISERVLVVLGSLKQSIDGNSLGQKLNQYRVNKTELEVDGIDITTMEKAINDARGLIIISETVTSNTVQQITTERMAWNDSTWDHVDAVRITARNMAILFIEKGIKPEDNKPPLNATKVEFLGLVHDLGRLFTWTSRHAILGSRLLVDLGFPTDYWNITHTHDQAGSDIFLGQETEIKAGQDIIAKLQELDTDGQQQLFDDLWDHWQEKIPSQLFRVYQDRLGSSLRQNTETKAVIFADQFARNRMTENGSRQVYISTENPKVFCRSWFISSLKYLKAGRLRDAHAHALWPFRHFFYTQFEDLNPADIQRVLEQSEKELEEKKEKRVKIKSL
jgi:hypothetical protein